MIVNTGMLLDYLSPRVPLGELLTALPLRGMDLEATLWLAQELAAGRVAVIHSKKPLEGTGDKFVCEVEVAPGDLRTIVAASTHPLEVGWGVPVAVAGTELPTGASIHE